MDLVEKDGILITIIDPESENADETENHRLANVSGASLDLDGVFDVDGTKVNLEFIVYGAVLGVFVKPSFVGAERINLCPGDEAIRQGDLVPFIGRKKGRKRIMMVDFISEPDVEEREPISIQNKLVPET